MTAGLLANLTCIQAELYEMEAAMSVGEDPLWIIPYTTIAEDFQYLLNDFTTYLTVSSLLLRMCHTMQSGSVCHACHVVCLALERFSDKGLL